VQSRSRYSTHLPVHSMNLLLSVRATRSLKVQAVGHALTAAVNCERRPTVIHLPGVRQLLWCIQTLWLIFVLGGCAIPKGTKVIAAHKVSREEIAFLDLPNATRDETVATLGPPFWEDPASRVLLYTWETSFEWQVSLPDQVGSVDLHARSVTVQNDGRRWGLFVAYDAQGQVSKHEVCDIGPGSLVDACSRWAKRLGTSQGKGP
jgi:hypothetical protein